MKKNPRKIALIGLAASVIFGAAGCNSQSNEESDVYGPPVTITEDENQLEDVYGPPVDIDENSKETEEDTESKEEKTEGVTEVNEDRNEMETVYGPPPGE